MPGRVFYNPSNYSQQVTVAPGYEANVPAGYVESGGEDGAIDVPQQTFQPGGASGGYPSYPTPNPGETFQAMIQRLDGSTAAGLSRLPG